LPLPPIVSTDTETVPGPLIEAVPNFSEGRRPDVIAQVTAAFTTASPDVALLDSSSDPDHNRTVLTLAGPAEGLLDAVVSGARSCMELIDLTAHSGVHPRIGSLDVVPFVPLGGVPLAICADLARAAGRRLAGELGLPVFLYGAAAVRPGHVALPAVRGRGFEALAEASADPARRPDLGGPGPHPTAGATAVGARPFLIAYNVDLVSQDLDLVRRIAAAVRERDGGLPAVRAIGLRLPERGRVQVSMNLLDFTVTPPAVAFDAVARLAAAAGVEVAGSELIGLVPEAALDGLDADLRAAVDADDRIIERRLAAALGRAQGA
jgi:glutamate formiminotransferase